MPYLIVLILSFLYVSTIRNLHILKRYSHSQLRKPSHEQPMKKTLLNLCNCIQRPSEYDFIKARFHTSIVNTRRRPCLGHASSADPLCVHLRSQCPKCLRMESPTRVAHTRALLRRAHVEQREAETLAEKNTKNAGRSTYEGASGT